MIGKSSLFARRAITQIVRNSSHGDGLPGSNLPFDVTNRYKLTAMFTLFIGSGLGIPFLVLRHQLLKK